VSAVLLVRLKIADLVAATALHAARNLLPKGHACERILREELFLFEAAEGFRADAFEGALAMAVKESNFFVNPNKESYRFLSARSRGESLVPPDGAWGILTRARDETRDEGLRARLLREHPLEGLGAIRRARGWWLWTRGPGGAPGIETCYEALGPVRDTKRGLLINPHAESDLRLDGPVSWQMIERFLTSPAPEWVEVP
jgi:hypothetical protein